VEDHVVEAPTLLTLDGLFRSRRSDCSWSAVALTQLSWGVGVGVDVGGGVGFLVGVAVGVGVGVGVSLGGGVSSGVSVGSPLGVGVGSGGNDWRRGRGRPGVGVSW